MRIYGPLEIIFNACLETGHFPSEQKNENAVSIYEKLTNSKRLQKNTGKTATSVFVKVLLGTHCHITKSIWFYENKLVSLFYN